MPRRPATRAEALLAVLTLALAGLALPSAAAIAQEAASPAPGTMMEIAAMGLVEVPVPAIDILEPPIQEQLLEYRSGLDEMLSREAIDPDQLGNAFGRMGQLYFVYDLPAAAEACFVNATKLLIDDFRSHHYLGTMLVTEGDMVKARAHLERSVELEPAYAPSHIRLGRLLLEEGELDAAEASFRAALELEPDNAAAHQGLGRVYEGRRDFVAAIPEFERALELQPDATSIHHPLGMAYRRSGDLEKARFHLQQVPTEQASVRLADPIVESLSGLIVGAQIHFKAGVDAGKAGQLDRAIEQFQIAASIDPEDHLTWYNLGLSLIKARETWSAPPSDEEIIRPLRRALEIDPDFRDGHFVLAGVYAKAGREEDAAFHYGEAHRIDPMDEEAHLVWALALARTGDEAAGERELESLLATNPEQPEALINLGSLYYAQGRTADAAALYRRILDLPGEVPEAAEAMLRMGDLSVERGDVAAAIGYYESGLEIDPEVPDAQVELGKLLGQVGRFAEAADHFDKALEMNPERSDVRFGRALALIFGEDYGRAAAGLEESVESAPGSVELKHLLARLLATCPDDSVRDGDRAVEMAFEVFRQAQSLDHAETVAMALAEAGRFDDAVSWQTRAVEEARRAGRADLADAAGRRLARYQEGRAVRSPWREALAAPPGGGSPGSESGG